LDYQKISSNYFARGIAVNQKLLFFGHVSNMRLLSATPKPKLTSNQQRWPEYCFICARCMMQKGDELIGLSHKRDTNAMLSPATPI
jgi:hypothetical protein